jgi:hypothetical protein
MDPAQLANEACKRFTALHSSTASSSALQASTAPIGPPGPAVEPLLDAFEHLATLDGWAKIAMTRLAADPQDVRAHAELRRSLEQAARLHPQFTRRLADVLADRPAVKTSLSNTGSLPLQHLS